MEKVNTTPFEDYILGSQFDPVLSKSKQEGDTNTASGILQCCQCNSSFADEQEALIHYKLHVIESHKSHFSVVTGGACPVQGCSLPGDKDALHFHCAHCQFAAKEILDLPLHMEKAHLNFYKKVSLVLRGQNKQINKVFKCGECNKSLQGTVSTLLHFFLHESDRTSSSEMESTSEFSEAEQNINGCTGENSGTVPQSIDSSSENISKLTCDKDIKNSATETMDKDSDEQMFIDPEVDKPMIESPTGVLEVPSEASTRIVLTNPQLASLQTRVLLPILLNNMRESKNPENPLNLLASLIDAEQKNEFPLMPPQHFLLSSSPETHKEEQEEGQYLPSPLEEGDPAPESLLNGYRELGDYSEKSAGVFQCDQCSDAFKYQYLLTAHRKQVHTVAKTLSTSFPYQCHVCGNEFTGLEDLKGHVWDHSVEYNFFCDTCGHAFTNQEQMTDHMESHTSTAETKGRSHKLSNNFERSNRCECCSVKFPSKAELTRHIVKYQGTCNPNKTGIRCATCGLDVESLDALKEHRVKDHPSSQSSGNKRGFECDYCGKTFSCRSNLRDHLVVHTGEKPYPCDICGKAFSFVHNMKTHRLTHNEGRNEMCSYCDRAYKSKISLYYHMKKGNCRGLSTREVPEGFFRCTECLQMFASEERFFQHKDKGHCQISYRCEHCGVRCSTEAKLTRHLAKGGCLQSTSESAAPKKVVVATRRSSRDNRGRGRRRLDSSEEVLCERCNYGHDCCCTFGCNYCGKRIFSFDAYNNHKRKVCPARRSKEKLKEVLEKRRKECEENVSGKKIENKEPVSPEEDSNSGSLTDLSSFAAAHLLETVSSVQET